MCAMPQRGNDTSWSKTFLAGNTFSAFFCVNTGEKPLERIKR